jgi:hypothetical protein
VFARDNAKETGTEQRRGARVSLSFSHGLSKKELVMTTATGKLTKFQASVLRCHQREVRYPEDLTIFVVFFKKATGRELNEEELLRHVAAERKKRYEDLAEKLLPIGNGNGKPKPR